MKNRSGKYCEAMDDFSYIEECGCKISFVASRNYKSLVHFPGKHCIVHDLRPENKSNRDDLIERAKHYCEHAWNIDETFWEV